MPDVSIEQPITLDVLGTSAPALSATSDMPTIEPKPDSIAAAMGKESTPAKAEDDVKPAAADEAKTSEDESADLESSEATEPESTSASDEPKKAKGVQKRLDELTKQREDAKREAEAERNEKLRLLALLEERKAAPEPEYQPAKPNRGDYDSEEAYSDAQITYAGEFAAWKVKSELVAQQQAMQDKQQRDYIDSENRKVRDTYAARVEKVKEKYSDYQSVAESPDVQISVPMAHAIAHAEQGPEIAYYLGKNPAEAKRISSLSPPVQLMELGLILGKINTPVTKSVSAAPSPIKPIKGSGDAASKSPDEMSMEEYATMRRKQMAAQARPGMRH